MNKQRLLRLAEHLESIHENPKPGVVFDLTHFKKENPCETRACAMGEACTIPEFAEAGLHLERSNYHREDKIGDVHYDLILQEAPFKDEFGTLHDGFYIESQAIQKFFDIDCDETKDLFYPRWDADYKMVTTTTALEVATDIRKFVSGKESESLIKMWKAFPKMDREKVINSLRSSQSSPKNEMFDLTIKLLKALSDSAK